MSRRWNRVVRLRIVPGSACATLECGWWRPRVLASSQQSIDAPDTEPSDADARPAQAGGAGLAAGVDAALRELAQAASLKGALLDVEVADALVHLDVVAGDFAAESERQLTAIAGACVAELLGEDAKEHEIRWQLQSDGRHLLIGAVARAQLQALAELAARHGLRLRSVQPDFCLQWNRHAKLLKPGAGVFAVACGRDAVVAQVARGTVFALSGGPWLDRQHAPGTSNAQAQRLMCGLGLEPNASAGALDLRVDRLLASAGSQREAQATYVLVAPQVSRKALSPRWTLIDREARPS